MKKLLTIIILAFTVIGCTQNTRARKLGGTAVIDLPKGEKLLEATFKDTQIWYLTEPAEEGYIPKTKTFREESSWGVLEGTVIFKEH